MGNTNYRADLCKEIIRLTTILGADANHYRVYVYHHFLGSDNGKVVIYVNSDTNVQLTAMFRGGLVGKFTLGQMSNRHLRHVRNALMRDYGKRTLRADNGTQADTQADTQAEQDETQAA